MRFRLSIGRLTGLPATLVVLATLATLGIASCGGNPAVASLPSSLSAAGPLLNSLGTAVPGLSQAQSILGAGSLLGLAKSKMPADQFSQIGNAIPGSDALVGEAIKQGLPTSLGSLSDVTGFLGKSGISPTQVNQMVPVMSKALGSKVSPALSNSFMTALK